MAELLKKTEAVTTYDIRLTKEELDHIVTILGSMGNTDYARLKLNSVNGYALFDYLDDVNNGVIA